MGCQGGGEVISVQVSRGRGLGECLRFLEKVKGRCRGKPTVYTDGGPWYTWPMKILKIRHRRETFGKRNSAEQWFSKLKREPTAWCVTTLLSIRL